MLKKFSDSNIFTLAVVIAALALTPWAAYEVFVLGHVHVHEENRLLENIQGSILAVACILFLYNSIREKRTDKAILLFFSLLCYCFALREFDVEKSNAPQALIFIGSGIGRNVSLTIGFLSILAYAAITNFTHYKNATISFIRSQPGLLLAAAGVLLQIAQFLERAHSLDHNEFYEEICELFGFSLMLLAAISTNSAMKNYRLIRK